MSLRCPNRLSRLARARARRLVVACLVALGVLGNVGAALHQSLVQHAVCAEHGEAVHGESGAANHTDALPSLAALPAQEPGDAHGHCGLSFSRRERLTAGAPAVFTVLPVAAREASAPVSAPLLLRSVAPLRLAPKTSPPVLA